MIVLAAMLIGLEASADTKALTGWGWSSNVGWVSFSSANDHNYAAPGVQTFTSITGRFYGVQLVQITGTNDYRFSGYAWSPNIGWVNFNPGTGFQPPYEGARLQANNTVVGWARACSVFVSGCSGTLKSSQARGGWDGWIKMSGTANLASYGVTRNASGTGFSGYAWGSLVVGWLDMSRVLIGGSVTQTCPDGTPLPCTTTEVPKLSLDFSATNGRLSISNPPLGAPCPTAYNVSSNAYDHCSNVGTITIRWDDPANTAPVRLTLEGLPTVAGYPAPEVIFNVVGQTASSRNVITLNGQTRVSVRTYFPNRAVNPPNRDIASPYASSRDSNANKNLTLKAQLLDPATMLPMQSNDPAVDTFVDKPITHRYSDPRQGGF